jgi:pilus assembly protein Flp/PilA
MLGWIKKFKKDQSGATAIEYTLIAALLTVAILAAFPLLEAPLLNVFKKLGKDIANAQ